MRNKNRTIFPILISVLIVKLTNAAQVTDVEKTYLFSDHVKQNLYLTFGSPYYTSDLKYPVPSRQSNASSLNRFRINLKPGKPLNRGADSTGWVTIPVKDGAAYYRAEYHVGDLAGVDVSQMVATTEQKYVEALRSRGLKKPWQLTESQRQDFIQKSKFQMIVFPTAQFRFQYFPGSILIWNQEGMINRPVGKTARGGVKWSRALAATMDQPGLLSAVFKATFDNEDTVRDGKYPGFIVDGVTVDEPADNLATLAAYQDGSFRLGAYSSLPKDGIVRLKQNEFPLLASGMVIDAGAYPLGWNRFQDHVMRSYIFASADGEYIGYVWTNYCHPSFIANTVRQLGFSEMMLLDIHPSIGAGARVPTPPGGTPLDFYKGGSYGFIPREQDIVNSLAMGFASAAQMFHRIQWDYSSTQKGSTGDFVGVFAK